jgi:hypothetical protein
MDRLIKTRWKVLPEEQRSGIRNFVVGVIVKTSSDEGTLRREKSFVNKLNLILVQILKQEWCVFFSLFLSFLPFLTDLSFPSPFFLRPSRSLHRDDDLLCYLPYRTRPLALSPSRSLHSLQYRRRSLFHSSPPLLPLIRPLLPSSSTITQASQLAQLHSRDRRLVPSEPLDLRKQHGHPQVVVGGDLRVLGGTDDDAEDEGFEGSDCAYFSLFPPLSLFPLFFTEERADGSRSPVRQSLTLSPRRIDSVKNSPKFSNSASKSSRRPTSLA